MTISESKRKGREEKQEATKAGDSLGEFLQEEEIIRILIEIYSYSALLIQPLCRNNLDTVLPLLPSVRS